MLVEEVVGLMEVEAIEVMDLVVLKAEVEEELEVLNSNLCETVMIFVVVFRSR
jgi:galactose-1-phosphate uridylyltransferase